ncbi:hypothetical protein ACFOLK_08460 [Marinococcus halophilus]|uniref:hypothetical protein n=2 Tax=Marinococcus halophilus TaxID=1371 RepID=UPI001180B57B|nr:hypothetical protein [Marinococcus halophilus]
MKQLFSRMQRWNVLNDKGEYYVLASGAQIARLYKEDVSRELSSGEQVEAISWFDGAGNKRLDVHLPDVQEEVFMWRKVVTSDADHGIEVAVDDRWKAPVERHDYLQDETYWPGPGENLFVHLEYTASGLKAFPASENDVQHLMAPAPADLHHAWVNATVYSSPPFGAFLLTADRYKIFVHESEWTHRPRVGEELKVRITHRQEDGSLNASMYPPKEVAIGSDAQLLLERLQQADGTLPFGDRSSPEAIRKEFGLSKAAFKRAVGALLKDQRIRQENNTLILESSEKRTD